jgi:hypothetical protein
MNRITSVLVVTLLSLLPAAPGRAQTVTHSGTVLTVDRGASTIVLGEIGPWRVRDGETEVVHHTMTVTPLTTFVRSRRLPGAGPTGWMGDFVEEIADPWAVRPGDFITVLCQHEGRFLTALEVVVAVIGDP